MIAPVLEIKSITQLHEGLGFEKHKHPLISIIDAAKVRTPPEMVGQRIVADMFMVALKDKSCGLEYGRNLYDFAERAHLSSHYLSDLLKKETGRTAKDHINDFVVEKAKNMLLSTSDSTSEITYDLGFNYPHYFTRVFKAKTGKTHIEYRSLN